MKIKPQKTAEQTKLGDMIKDMSVAMLTTFCEEEGYLKVSLCRRKKCASKVPFGF